MTPDTPRSPDEVRREVADVIAARIAATLQRIRADRRLSLQEVADRAGLSKGYVWELENGRTANPTISSTIGIARALGVSVDYLIGFSTDLPPLHPEALRIACEIDALLRATTLQLEEPS